MKNDENKKSGLPWIFMGIIALAVILVCIFGKNIDKSLRDFFNKTGTSKVDSYVLYSKEKKRDEKEGKRGTEEINLLPVPYVEMTEEFPTGCESSSAVMLLQYYGIDIDLKDFVDGYLTCSSLKVKKGKITGPSPYQAFIGNPREQGGYGCFAPVIEESMAKILNEKKNSGKGLEVKNLTGASIKELEKYIAEGTPVLIWATGNMSEPTDGTKWRITGTKETFTWPRGEHCLVMTGADEENYYFSDPTRGEGIAYEKGLAEKRYVQMGSQALILTYR